MNLSFIEWYVGKLKLAAIKTPSGPIVTPRILAAALGCPEEVIRRFINDNKSNFDHLQSLTESLTPNKEINEWIESEGLKQQFLVKRLHPDTKWLNHYSVAEVLYRSEAKNAFKTRIEFTKLLEKTWKESTISIEKFELERTRADHFEEIAESLRAKNENLENRVESLERTVGSIGSHLGSGLFEVGEYKRRSKTTKAF